MQVSSDQLKKFIQDSGLVTTTEISRAEKKAKERHVDLGEVLVAEGKISEDDLRRTEAYVLGIPFVSLRNQRIDFAVLSLIPEPIARNHNVVAYRKQKDELEVAMLDTDDLSAIDFVKKKVGLKILPRLTDSESIKSSLLQYKKTLKAEFDDIIEKEIHLIKGQEYEFQFRSQDVIHSAFFPHFRAQMNTVPGMITRLKMTPKYTTAEMKKLMKNEKFEFVLLCNKICGAAHQNMQLPIYVWDLKIPSEKAAYEAWMTKARAKAIRTTLGTPDIPKPIEAGEPDTAKAQPDTTNAGE